tara:strand:- start:340 stop:651 length:312 start_codon:yes stop_codon:yes gene_type:complete
MEVRVVIETLKTTGILDDLICHLIKINTSGDFARYRVEWNPGYSSAWYSSGWYEIVGYRPLNEKEIAMKKKAKESNKKRMSKKIKEAKAGVAELEKKLKDMGD